MYISTPMTVMNFTYIILIEMLFYNYDEKSSIINRNPNHGNNTSKLSSVTIIIQHQKILHKYKYTIDVISNSLLMALIIF
jgi:hypothetical protein